MWKALVRKELRELAGITALAAIAYTVLVTGLMGMRPFSELPLIDEGAQSVPFLTEAFGTLFSAITLVFALSLAFRQSARERARHTYLFLLHRPMARRGIFLIKTATGLSLLLILSAICILAYALWAATPGTHPAPFYWSMTARSWTLWFACPVVYLGAFLSGLRWARWFGTRLLPLAASGIVFLMLTMMLISGEFPLAVLIGVALLVDVLMAVAICHVAYTEDFS